MPSAPGRSIILSRRGEDTAGCNSTGGDAMIEDCSFHRLQGIKGLRCNGGGVATEEPSAIAE